MILAPFSLLSPHFNFPKADTTTKNLNGSKFQNLRMALKTGKPIKATSSPLCSRESDKDPYLWSLGIQLSHPRSIIHGAIMATHPKSLITVIFLIIKVGCTLIPCHW